MSREVQRPCSEGNVRPLARKIRQSADRIVNGHAARSISTASSSRHPESRPKSRTEPSPSDPSSSRRPSSSSHSSQPRPPVPQTHWEQRKGKAPERVREREVEVQVRVENRLVGDHEEEDAAQPEAPEQLLDGVPLEVQEAWICEDLMFVLQVS